MKNRVGTGGKGESVWLGWMLHAALDAFANLADARSDFTRAVKWRAHMRALATAFENQAWDGDWYQRAWFDDGAPLGSATNDECRINSIAQSWAVLSGAGRREPRRPGHGGGGPRADPASRRPGVAVHAAVRSFAGRPRIRQGYPPGVRDGGHYTHAALWSVMAFAGLGEGDKAAALFWMLNPINHAGRHAQRHSPLQGQPYVVAADVYAAPAHVGRGGWTWYTGSAGWMQRAGVESILGLRIEGSTLRLEPCIPRSWPRFEIMLRHGASRYEIVVDPQGVQRGVAAAELDGMTIPVRPLSVPLKDDGAVHRLQVRLG